MQYLADYLMAEQDCLGGGFVWYSRYGFQLCINHGYLCSYDGVLLEC